MRNCSRSSPATTQSATASGVSTPSPCCGPGPLSRSSLRVDALRAQDEDADIVVAMRDRQAFGKSDRRVLGRRIDRVADLRQQPRGRNRQQKRAAAARLHPRCQHAGGMDMAHDIDRPGAMPGLVRRRRRHCPPDRARRRCRRWSSRDRSGRNAARPPRRGGARPPRWRHRRQIPSPPTDRATARAPSPSISATITALAPSR